MIDPLEFEYIVAEWYLLDSDPRPIIPLQLRYMNSLVDTWALIDSGADMSFLPLHIGEELGLSWERSTQDFQLLSLAGSSPAKAVAVDLRLGHWPSLKIAFAWSAVSETAVILGQQNFFQLVDVCFSRSQGLVRLELAGQ
jgi:hypothetical protein